MIHCERVGPESAAILRNLYELYVHDMSEWFGLEVGADGSFGHDTRPLWEGDGTVYLARVDDSLAGFAVVQSGERWWGRPDARDIKDFFVLRRHRHQQVGRAMARQVWGASAAPWIVRVLVTNRPAVAFWRQQVSDYTGARHQEIPVSDHGRDWLHLRFDASRQG